MHTYRSYTHTDHTCIQIMRIYVQNACTNTREPDGCVPVRWGARSCRLQSFAGKVPEHYMCICVPSCVYVCSMSVIWSWKNIRHTEAPSAVNINLSATRKKSIILLLRLKPDTCIHKSSPRMVHQGTGTRCITHQRINRMMHPYPASHQTLICKTHCFMSLHVNTCIHEHSTYSHWQTYGCCSLPSSKIIKICKSIACMYSFAYSR